MGKRLHYPKNLDTPDDGHLLCKLEPPNPYVKTTNGNNPYKRKKYKTTTKPENVTCERCLERIANQLPVFACPSCKQTTDMFYVTESVVVCTIISASSDRRRKTKRTTDRTLLYITCPLCGNKTYTTEQWQEFCVKLKIDGYNTSPVLR
jgi:Zn finger protein HypA/HybF involved in hydrogenase expression